MKKIDEEIETEEKVALEIEVANDMVTTIKVKKKMTSLEFLGLMTKAKQMFNVSNKTVEQSGQHRKYSPRVDWTPEMKAKLKKLCKQKKTINEIKNDSTFSMCSSNQLKCTLYQMGLKPGKKVVED